MVVCLFVCCELVGVWWNNFECFARFSVAIHKKNANRKKRCMSVFRKIMILFINSWHYILTKVLAYQSSYQRMTTNETVLWQHLVDFFGIYLHCVKKKKVLAQLLNRKSCFDTFSFMNKMTNFKIYNRIELYFKIKNNNALITILFCDCQTFLTNG